ncbi:MAG: class I SAM-dependent methyltransferase [Saprospiraceae bacterium]|nr:class I SAM-dependent methyltransferase [Saprospiraceae bacterium]
MKSLIALLFLFPLLLAAQPDTSGQHRLIKGLLDYRHELIARNPEGFKKLYCLDTLWKVENKEAINDMLSGVTYLNKFYGATAEQIILASKMLGLDTFEFRRLVTVEILQAIIENDDMALLMGEQLLKPKPPFLINADNSFFEEVAFYKIQDGMTIGEIGAGTGMFGLLLGLAYDSLTIYMNDTAERSMAFAYDRVERCRSIKSGNRYFVAEGKRKSTMLEKYSMDKIVIRNAFHHFSNKQKMLASIKKSMKAESELLLFEPDRVEGKQGVCPQAMKFDKMKQTLMENGFKVIEEKRIEKWDWVLIRCKLADSN